MPSPRPEDPIATATRAAQWAACEGSPASRLHPDDIAYVSFDPPYSNRVRANPNWNTGAVLGLIEPGERVEVVDGPACENNVVWWFIRSLEQDLTGWTVEGDQEDYWLVPLNQP